MSGFATLTTGAATANRYPGTCIRDASGVEIGELENSAITAGSTQKLVYTMSHNWQASGGIPSEQTAVVLSLPYFVLPPGYRVGSVTANLQGGDRYSQIDLLFERWASEPYYDAWAPSLRVR